MRANTALMRVSVTLLAMVVIAVVGAVYFVIAGPDRKVAGHVRDTLELTGGERHG